MMKRNTRIISIGGKKIGGDSPILVQSMTNTKTSDFDKTYQQIFDAASAGAEIMRVSIPDKNALDSFSQLTAKSPVPLVADIHFDYKLAIGAIKAGASKIRINPGNIGANERIKEICKCANDYKIPIRIGINAGSLETDILKKYQHPGPDALVESAIRNIKLLQSFQFEQIVVSIKSSDVMTTVEACRQLSQRTDFPLHVGVTEAGTLLTGAVRSAVGLGILINENIGDTIRVSLAADPIEEIHVAYQILDSLNRRKMGPTIIACPTCGRTEIDIIKLANDVEKKLRLRRETLTVAVMGCIVNGPGEAKEADIGIAGGKKEGLLFRKGKPLRKVKEDNLLDAIIDLFDEVAAEKNSI